MIEFPGACGEAPGVAFEDGLDALREMEADGGGGGAGVRFVVGEVGLAEVVEGEICDGGEIC